MKKLKTALVRMAQLFKENESPEQNSEFSRLHLEVLGEVTNIVGLAAQAGLIDRARAHDWAIYID
jgi:hypothetical protein